MTQTMFDIINEYAVSAELDTAYDLMNDCIKNSTILEQYDFDESMIPEEFLMEAATTNGGPGFGTRVRARMYEHRVKTDRAIDQANERLERRPGERMLTRFLLFLPRLIMAIINFFRWLIRRLTRRRNTVHTAARAASGASSETRSRINSSWSTPRFTSSIRSGSTLSSATRSALSTGHQLPGPTPGTTNHSSGSNGPSGPSGSGGGGRVTTGHQLPGGTRQGSSGGSNPPGGGTSRSSSGGSSGGGRVATDRQLPSGGRGSNRSNGQPPANISDGNFESWTNQAKSTDGLKKEKTVKEVVDENFTKTAVDAAVTGKFKGLPILNRKFVSALNNASKALDDLNDWCGKLDRADNKVTSSGGHVNDHGDKYTIGFNQAQGWARSLETKANKLRECYNKMTETIKSDDHTSFTSQQLTEAYDAISDTLNHMNDTLTNLQHEVSGSGNSQLAKIVKALQKKDAEIDPRAQGAYMNGVRALAEAMTKMKEAIGMTSEALDYTVHCCELIIEMIKQAGGKIENQRTVGFSTAVRNERGQLRDSEKMPED